MRTTEDRASGELREGYADVGDVRLHYVEAGEGPLVVLLHGFPEFWYGWREQIAPLAAAGFRVVAPDMRGYKLSSKPDGVHAYDTGQLTADIAALIRAARRRVRAAGRARLGRVGRLGHRDGLPRGGGPAGHLERGAPAQAGAGTAPPRAAPQVLVLLLLRPPRPARNWSAPAGRWHFFRHFLHDASPAFTPEEMDRYLQAWSQPGAATGMINYYRPRCGPAQTGRSGAPAHQGAHAGHLGGRPIATSARNSPSPTTTTCPASTASSACPTPRTGCIHDEAERVTRLLTGFFAPALAK